MANSESVFVSPFNIIFPLFTIRVLEHKDSIAIKWHGTIVDLTEIYHKEEINEARIRNIPQLSDVVLGLFRIREYYWRPSSKER